MSSKTRQISWHYLGVKWQGNTSPVFRGHQDWEEFCLSLHNAVQILWSRSDFTTNERAEETPKYLSGTWHFFTAGFYDIPIFRYLFHRKNGHIRIPKTTHDHMFNSQRFTKTQGKFLVQKTSPTLQKKNKPNKKLPTSNPLIALMHPGLPKIQNKKWRENTCRPVLRHLELRDVLQEQELSGTIFNLKPPPRMQSWQLGFLHVGHSNKNLPSFATITGGQLYQHKEGREIG